jgi:hypothetical protein
MSQTTKIRACRVCGCTDEDCSGCIERTGEPCSWVDDDLCSACDGVEMRACESCKAVVALDTMAHLGEGFDVCVKCAKQWLEVFYDCTHKWREGDFNEYGDPGRSCSRCGGFIEDDFAVEMFPLVCDGWVALTTDAA